METKKGEDKELTDDGFAVEEIQVEVENEVELEAVY